MLLSECIEQIIADKVKINFDIILDIECSLAGVQEAAKEIMSLLNDNIGLQDYDLDTEVEFD